MGRERPKRVHPKLPEISQRPQTGNPRPRRLPFYILTQLLGPVALLTLLLTSVIWLVSCLQYLDLVINRGQSAPTFLYLILLVLPTPLVAIMPIAFFFATFFLGGAASPDGASVVPGAGAAALGPSARSKPLVTFSSSNLFTSVSARVSVWANSVVISSGVLRPAE